MRKYHGTLTLLVAAGSFAWLAGCKDDAATGDGSTTAPAAGEGGGEEADHGHAHGAGPHDGTLADWGGGKYHVEFTVSHPDKQATVYILGDDEKTATPIKATEIKLVIASPAIDAVLKAMPQEGDPEGTSSRFVGTHDNLGIVQEYAGTISGEVDGTPYSGDFKEEPHGH
jgi:hypothetical protein